MISGEARIAELERGIYQRHWDYLIAQREEVIKKAGGIEANANQEELNRLKSQLKLLEEAETTAGLERERQIADDNAQRLEREKQFRSALFGLTQEYIANERESLRKSLDLALEYAARHTIITRQSRAQIAADRATFDLEDIDARYARLQAQRKADEAELLDIAKTEEDKRDIRERYNALRLQDEERWNAERRTRMKQANEEAGEVDIKGDIKEWFNKEFPDISPMQFAADTITNSFKTMKGAVLESIDAFIFFGATIGQVMRRAVAEVLASIAKEAAIQGIKEAAMALASLAVLDFRGAALHGASSAMWFGIAGGAMLAGRSVAAPLYQQAGAGASAAAQRGTQGAATANEVKVIEMDRRRAESVVSQPDRAAPAKVEVTLHLKSSDSHIINTVVKNYQQSGNIRLVINQDGMLATA
jgi:hypothetical protein